MISIARRIPVLRYLLIISLVTLLFTGIIYLLFRIKKAHQLQASVENLISARENSALIDSCIINLYSADNSSRLYTITGDKTYLKKFNRDIDQIGTVIEKIKIDNKTLAYQDSLRFRNLVKQKTEKTDSYIKLRLLTDSLIKYSNKINRSLSNMRGSVPNPVIKVQHVIRVDTFRQAASQKSRKKFFGRLIEAIAGKNDTAEATATVVKTDTMTTTTLAANDTAATVKKHAFKKYYQTLNAVNDKLRRNEHQILMINNNLIGEIISTLKLYKSAEELYISSSKNELKESLSNVFFEYKRISTLTMVFLVLLLVIVFYNIWKIFRNEQEIIEYSEKAEQYAESKSRFLAGMSHEIRTPLNSVIGFSEQLGQQELPAQQREQIDAIRSSSEMLLELVNEILDFSKYETGKMNFDNAPFMLSQAIDEIFNSMNVHAQKKGLYLENKVNIDDQICCEGDKMRLKQVIMNLMGNAIKFTVKGRITLSANVEQQLNNKALLKVTVKDTGLGIAKDDLAHLFEEFSQVAMAQKATRHKGTGLGLAICKKIVELQGGNISVASEPGEGSAFSFELPLTQCEPAEVVAEQVLSDELMAELVKGKHILFTEDNKLNVLLGTTILKKWNISFDVAYNGNEALRLFKANNYDMVLTDIQMPELNGLELTELIRNYPDTIKSHIPIMALTANVMKEDRDIYFKAGINDVILKPFLEKNLIEKVALSIQNNMTVLRFVS